MQTALNVIQIIIAIVLILVIMFQVRGGGLGGIFGQAESVYRTKRGVEKWLFWTTIILSVFFVILALISFAIG
jgi:preprotein translocase subunit SecG